MVIKNPSSLFSFTLSTMPLIILLLFFFAFLLQEDFLKHNYGLIYFCVPHLHPLFKHCLKTHFFHVTSPINLFSNRIWVFWFLLLLDAQPNQIRAGSCYPFSCKFCYRSHQDWQLTSVKAVALCYQAAIWMATTVFPTCFLSCQKIFPSA